MRSRRVLMLLVLALVLAGCSDPLARGGEGGSAGEIIVGSPDVPESRLLAEIYAGALRNAGASEVTVRPPVGGREVVVKALRDKSLSVVPDYTGNLLRYFDKGNEVTTPERVYTELRGTLPPEFTLLEPAPAQDKDLLVVRKELADQGVRTFSDLGSRCGDLTFGGPGQWAERWKAKVKTLYDCEFKQIRATDTGGPVTVAALAENEIQVADLFSTASTIESNGFVPLVDDKNMFPAQNVVPLTATGALDERQQHALNQVSRALTTRKLTELNVEYTEDKRNPTDIAEDFLRDNGLG